MKAILFNYQTSRSSLELVYGSPGTYQGLYFPDMNAEIEYKNGSYFKVREHSEDGLYRLLDEIGIQWGKVSDTTLQVIEVDIGLAEKIRQAAHLNKGANDLTKDVASDMERILHIDKEKGNSDYFDKKFYDDYREWLPTVRYDPERWESVKGQKFVWYYERGNRDTPAIFRVAKEPREIPGKHSFTTTISDDVDPSVLFAHWKKRNTTISGRWVLFDPKSSPDPISYHPTWIKGLKKARKLKLPGLFYVK